MFENRSFDNLLGRLYQPGEVPSFAGVTGLGLSNPVPEWAAGANPGTAPRLVPYGTATDMTSPSPDPGEEYPHVNTQLFNVDKPQPCNQPPYNLPSSIPLPTMKGFVADYIQNYIYNEGMSDIPTEHPLVSVDLGPVVGTHAGPNTVGVCYIIPARAAGTAG